jgi:hypothetical protein
MFAAVKVTGVDPWFSTPMRSWAEFSVESVTNAVSPAERPQVIMMRAIHSRAPTFSMIRAAASSSSLHGAAGVQTGKSNFAPAGAQNPLNAGFFRENTTGNPWSPTQRTRPIVALVEAVHLSV